MIGKIRALNQRSADQIDHAAPQFFRIVAHEGDNPAPLEILRGRKRADIESHTDNLGFWIEGVFANGRSRSRGTDQLKLWRNHDSNRHASRHSLAVVSVGYLVGDLFTGMDEVIFDRCPV